MNDNSKPEVPAKGVKAKEPKYVREAPPKHPKGQDNFIKTSDIWGATQLIVKIHKQMAQGCGFKESAMKQLVNVMLTYLHSVTHNKKPEEKPCSTCADSFLKDGKDPWCKAHDRLIAPDATCPNWRASGE